MITRNGNRLEVAGNLTMVTASALYNSGLEAQGATSLVVDLARVEAVDSSAVSLLLSWLREA
ncbi:MAG TPA: STAS domain-containing protein, partial [Gallionellaceae bacterium]